MILCDPFLPAEIIFRNDGQDLLTACTIHYGITGGASNTMNWTGAVAPLESFTLALDPIETLAGLPNNTFYVSLEEPNYSADPTSFNNSREHYFSIAPQV